MDDEASWPEGLKQNASLLSSAERKAAVDLLKLNQQHLFSAWEAEGTNDDRKHAFFEQAAELNKSCSVLLCCTVPLRATILTLRCDGALRCAAVAVLLCCCAALLLCCCCAAVLR
jgi:hypothetical protein